MALVVPGEPEPGPDVALTPRELDVLALIAKGASNKAIARRLAISIHTVKFHIASLLDKLDAQGRAEAVAQGAARRDPALGDGGQGHDLRDAAPPLMSHPANFRPGRRLGRTYGF